MMAGGTPDDFQIESIHGEAFAVRFAVRGRERLEGR